MNKANLAGVKQGHMSFSQPLSKDFDITITIS